jgi:hypothetical protein
LLGDKTHEIITLNKDTRPQEVVHGSSRNENQYDVRASGNLVSLYRNAFQRGKDTTITTRGDPLEQHSTDVLGKRKGVIYGDTNFYVN